MVAAETAHDAGSSQCLSFRIGEEEYAVDLLRVREVVRYEAVTRLPRLPACVRGVVDLRGDAVPAIDLALGLGGREAAVTAETCLVIVEVVADGQPAVVGLRADAVTRVVDLRPEDLEPNVSRRALVPTTSLAGSFVAGGRTVLLLDLDRLPGEDALARGGAAPPREIGAHPPAGAHPHPTAAADGDRQHLVLSAGGEPYALPLLGVSGIVPFQSVERMAGGPRALRGAVALQSDRVAVVDLAIVLGGRGLGACARGSVLVAEAARAGRRRRIGLAVEGVSRVLELGPDDVAAVPRVGRLFQADCVRGMARVDGGLVPILDPERLFALEELRAAAAALRRPRPRKARASGRTQGDRS